MTMTTTNTTSNLKGNKTMKLRNKTELARLFASLDRLKTGHLCSLRGEKIRLLENLTVAQNILSQVEQLQQINLVLAARGKD